ncbi:MAG: acyl-CoA thioesterase [Puniceicoccales bacterium]|nr:acyl-CoA thioesterase [Puniceicoccales bacterium]
MPETPHQAEIETRPHHDHFVTVSDADIDVNHHANNVVYVRWVQEAATAHWEKTVPPEIAAANTWVVMRHEIDYKRAAKLGENLRVRTWVETMSAVVSERHCQIWRDSDNTLIAQVKTLWCTINPDTGRPRRMDPRIPAYFGI